MLSMHAHEEYVGAALQAGACGYVLKDDAFTQLLGAIHSVHAGGLYLSPPLARHGLADYRRLAAGATAALEKISAREREILQLIAEGNANAEIAEQLGISVRTVETHRARLMEKLAITTTAGLTRFALKHGLISLDG
jgi:DNA-binding NarL/FixJ family response regulator